MKNEAMEQKITELLIRDEPKEPRRCELGGGYLLQVRVVVLWRRYQQVHEFLSVMRSEDRVG